MPRCLFLCCCLLALIAPVQATEREPDLAYSLGVRLGERLRDEVPELELQALLDGLAQAYRGEPLKLQASRIEQVLTEHETRLATRQLESQDADALRAEKRFLANEKAKAGVRELAGGVLRQELRAGNGGKPKANGRVRVRYAGRLADGSLFDESHEAQWFRLDSLIAGWRLALLEMPAGAKWRLVIPSAQAYGAEGAGELIPPHAPLVFELELLETAD